MSWKLKLNCLSESEPKLRIAAQAWKPAPAPFSIFHKKFYRKNHSCWRSFEKCSCSFFDFSQEIYRKNHSCWRSFENCYNFNPVTWSKMVIFRVSYKTIRSRSWSRSPNSDLRIRGAVDERNIFAPRPQHWSKPPPLSLTSLGPKGGFILWLSYSRCLSYVKLIPTTKCYILTGTGNRNWTKRNTKYRQKMIENCAWIGSKLLNESDSRNIFTEISHFGYKEISFFMLPISFPDPGP